MPADSDGMRNMSTTADASGEGAGRAEVGRDWSRTAWTAAAWGGLALALLWSWGPAEMGRWPFLITDADNMAEYASGFARPDFADWRTYLREMVVTIQIALWGTFLAIVLAVPFGILSAGNMAPWWVRQPVRRLMDLFRAIHEIVFAVLFVVAVGLGPFAGVMALFRPHHRHPCQALLRGGRGDRPAGPWRASVRPAPRRCRRSSTASSRRCCRSG